MSRTSRIVRRPGSRFLSIFAEDVERFGLACASVVALLDFFDRAQEQGGLPTASRARIVAELEGLVGRNAVDKALVELLEKKIISKHKKTEWGQRNFVKTITYGLDAAVLSALLLGTPETGSPGESPIREFPGLPDSGPETGVPSSLNEERSSSSTDDAEISVGGGGDDKRSRFEEIHGITTWTFADREVARTLVEKVAAEELAAAIAAIEDSGKEPLPGRVRQKLAARANAVRAAVRRAHNAELEAAARATADEKPETGEGYRDFLKFEKTRRKTPKNSPKETR